MEKNEIINHLNNLLKSNIWASKESIYEKAFRNRVIGFRSELDFFLAFKDKDLYQGGYILPVKSRAKTLDNPIYFTISSSNESDYIEIYKILSKKFFSKLYFIKFLDYGIENWKVEKLKENYYPIPKFNVYEFTNSKFTLVSNTILTLSNNYPDKFAKKLNFKVSKKIEEECIQMLELHTRQDIINTYVDRLVFDGYIGFTKYRGIASDIDVIIKKENNYNFVEIKEKDLSKRKPIGFGMDLERINNLSSLQQNYPCDYYYIVKEVNNQSTRNFLNWYYINIIKFIEKTKNNVEVEGGGGMSNLSTNPTLVCELKYFQKI